MFDVLKTTKKIHEEEYNFNKDNYFDYKKIAQKNNYIFLMEEDQITEIFIDIGDLIYAINNFFPETIFLILDKNKKNEIEVLGGYSSDYLAQDMIFKNSFQAEALERNIEQIIKKINIIKKITKKRKIIVFNLSKDTKEILSLFLSEDDYEEKNIVPVLKKAKKHQKISFLIKPFLITFILLLSLYLVLNNYTNKYIDKIIATNQKREINFKKNVIFLTKKRNKLKKEFEQDIAELNNIKTTETSVYYPPRENK